MARTWVHCLLGPASGIAKLLGPALCGEGSLSPRRPPVLKAGTSEPETGWTLLGGRATAKGMLGSWPWAGGGISPPQTHAGSVPLLAEHRDPCTSGELLTDRPPSFQSPLLRHPSPPLPLP